MIIRIIILYYILKNLYIFLDNKNIFESFVNDFQVFGIINIQAEILILYFY